VFPLALSPLHPCGRHAGSRNALLRLLVHDLQRLAVHTHLLPEFEPEPPTDTTHNTSGTPAGAPAGAGDAEGAGAQATGAAGSSSGSGSGAAVVAGLVAGSGKVALLEGLLAAAAARGQRVMVVSHHDKVGRVHRRRGVGVGEADQAP
jgi:hypothetical protein